MKLIKPSLVSVLVVSLLGCSSTPDLEDSKQEKVYSQTEIDLIVAKAKADERIRIEKELNRQQQTSNIFSQIRDRQNQTKQKNTVISTGIFKDLRKKSSSLIIPTSRDPVFYKGDNGVQYFRCAANSLVPVLNKDNHWVYDSSNEELSATLCKRSRDKIVMKKLQTALYDLGLLRSNTLTKEQLIDGYWGSSTLEAVKKYQKQNGLLYGQLTIQTLEKLGVFSRNENNEGTPKTLNSLDVNRNDIGQDIDLTKYNDAYPDMDSASYTKAFYNDDSTDYESPTDDLSNANNTTSDLVAVNKKGAIEAHQNLKKKLEKEEINKNKVVEDNIDENKQSINVAAITKSEEAIKSITPKLENSMTADTNTNNENLVKVIENIIPKNRRQHLYQKVGGAKYYRCAANSLVPQKNEEGVWVYSSEKEELSATLCKRSRDVATMTDLQYILNEKGYLVSNTLTKDQLLSGVWGQDTLAAVKKYQRENGLLYGQLTIETLEHLGVFKPDKNRVKWGELKSNQTITDHDNGQQIKPVQDNSTKQASSVKTAVTVEPADIEVATKKKLDDKIVTSSKEFNSILTDLTPLEVVKSRDDHIDYSLLQPQLSKPVFYARLNGKTPLWRCRARASIAIKNIESSFSYDDTKQYRATLCKMSRSESIIKQLQLALKEKGYLKPSPPLDLVVIDGIWGINTLNALKAYQRANGLAYGQLTIESLEKLGVFKSH